LFRFVPKEKREKEKKRRKEEEKKYREDLRLPAIHVVILISQLEKNAIHHQADLRFHDVDYNRTQISINVGGQREMLNNII